MSGKFRAADESILFCMGHYSQSHRANNNKTREGGCSCTKNYFHHNHFNNNNNINKDDKYNFFISKNTHHRVHQLHHCYNCCSCSCLQTKDIIIHLIDSFARTKIFLIRRRFPHTQKNYLRLCEQQRLVERSKETITRTISHRQRTHSTHFLIVPQGEFSYRFCRRRCRINFTCQCQL